MGKLYSLEADLRAQLMAFKVRRFKLEDKFIKLRGDMYDLQSELALVDHNIEELWERLKVYD